MLLKLFRSDSFFVFALSSLRAPIGVNAYSSPQASKWLIIRVERQKLRISGHWAKSLYKQLVVLLYCAHSMLLVKPSFPYSTRKELGITYFSAGGLSANIYRRVLYHS